jgi:tetratricopeptide (TPR) repeat protein
VRTGSDGIYKPSGRQSPLFWILMFTSLLVSGCSSIGDWSVQHHLRIYERYRLVAHHDLSDGRFNDAIVDLKRALRDLNQAKPNDISVQDSSAIELGNMYLACGDPKSALQSYLKVDSGGAANAQSKLAAEAAAGRGFALLKLNERAQAAKQFERALQLYKERPAAAKTEVFPIDLCSDCCLWGLEQSRRSASEPLQFERVAGKPLLSECLIGRMFLTNSLVFSKAKVGGIADSAVQKLGISVPATTIGGNGRSRPELDLQASWSTLLHAGKRAALSNEDERAERYFKSAISLLERNKDKSARMVESLQSLSFFYLKRDRRNEAAPFLLKEVELQKQRFGNDNVALVAPMGRYGMNCFRLGYRDTADKYMTEAARLSTRYLKDKTEIAALLHSNMSELRLAQGRWAECEAECRKAIEVFEKVSPTNKGRIATCNFIMVGALHAQKRFAEAEKALELSHPLTDLQGIPAPVRLDVLLTEAEFAIRRNDINSAKIAALGARAMYEKIKVTRGNKPGRAVLRMSARLKSLETLLQFKGASK